MNTMPFVIPRIRITNSRGIHKTRILNLFAIALLLLCQPASADTDYACLKACKNSANANLTTCTDKCTYDTPDFYSEKQVSMDKICFRNCIGNGVKASTCLPDCSTVSDAVTTRRDISRTTEDKHDQLDAPTPYGGLTLKPPRRPQEPVRDMDYTCLNSCAHGGLQYQLCSQRCVK